jgi:hypothetical protein
VHDPTALFVNVEEGLFGFATVGGFRSEGGYGQQDKGKAGRHLNSLFHDGYE